MKSRGLGPLRETLGLALGTLATHKARSFLTALGVTIGTSCVVLVGALMTGLDESILNELKTFGTDTLFIYKFEPGIRKGKLSQEERMRKDLSYDDYVAIKEGSPACRQVLLNLVNSRFSNARYGKEEYVNAQVEGSQANYPETMSMVVGQGRFFTATEDLHREAVCVIGSDVAKSLFPHASAVGKTITAEGHSFLVIGVFEKRRTIESFGDRSMDGHVIIPYMTYRKVHPLAKEHFIVAQAYKGMLGAAMEQIRGALRKSRKVKHGDPDSFGMTTATSIIREFRNITRAVTVVIVILSALGLLVGGVGVMNIMLVSVTERTREIGTRMAIGARRRDILLQFLLEAGTLTGVGGLCGIGLGTLASSTIHWLVPKIPTIVPLWAVILGFSFSVGIGLIFGIWPAMRAARMNPVEALRFE